MCQHVRAFLVSPVIGNEHGVGPDRTHNAGLKGDIGPPGRDRHPVLFHDAMLLRKARVNLDARFRIDVDQPADAPGLRARKILTDDRPVVR